MTVTHPPEVVLLQESHFFLDQDLMLPLFAEVIHLLGRLL